MTLTLPSGLFKRGKSYAVRISIPKKLQPVIGKKEIVRGLGTTDLSEALAQRSRKIAEVRAELFDSEIPRTIRGQAKQDPSQTTISSTARRWLAESDGIKASTRHRYRYILDRFAAFTGDAQVTKIDRATALAYMDHLKLQPSKRTGEPLSQRSLFTHQICLASYWRVLDHWGLVDPDIRNPFSSLLRRVAGQKKKADPRSKELRPVTREEAEDLLRFLAGNAHLKYRWEMFVTVRLLWVTGCRLNEICSRYLSEIEDHRDHIRITIPEAKTEAGKRTVMVVGESDCELLRRAITKAKITAPSCSENQGRLFPRITLGGYDRHPSHYLGRALEAARKNLDCSPNQWDMHSFRRSAVSALVNAGVAKEARNLCIGHANAEDIGMSVYAKRADLSEIIKSTFCTLYDELGGSLRVELSV